MSFCASEGGGICSANCPVCVSRPLDHRRKLREPDCQPVSSTERV